MRYLADPKMQGLLVPQCSMKELQTWRFQLPGFLRENMGEGVLWLLCPAMASGTFNTKKVSLQSDHGKVSMPGLEGMHPQPRRYPVHQCGGGRTALPLRHTAWSPHMAPAKFLGQGLGSLAARNSGKQSVVVTFLITMT